MNQHQYNIHLLPASFGDSILIEYGERDMLKYILIDGGPYFNYESLIHSIKAVAPEMRELELLIVTHIDIDHIDGIVTMLNQVNLSLDIKEIWFNGYEQLNQIQDDTLGVLQGDYLSALIQRHSIPHNETHFGKSAVVVDDFKNLPNFKLAGGMNITILSPGIDDLRRLKVKWEEESKYLDDLAALTYTLDKDGRYEPPDLLGDDDFDIKKLQDTLVTADISLANKSSIAFIGEYNGKSCLFSGDATSECLIRAISPILSENDLDTISFDAWKIAHHGSKKSTIDSLMEMISAKKILVSSNGTRFKHPNPETIAKLIGTQEGPIFYFNYRTAFTEVWDNEDLKEEYKYDTTYPKTENGITVMLIEG